MKPLWVKIKRFFPFFMLALLTFSGSCYANNTTETCDQDIAVSLCLIIVALLLWREAK